MTDEKESKALELRPTQNQPLQVSELHDPEKEIEFAQKAAKALVGIINSKKKKVVINGEQYLEYGDWQTIARFYNITVGSEKTEEINKNGKLVGFLAKAVVYRNGTQISSAEASCMRDEKNWGTKPEFQLRSMAQTRAAAKALRNVLGWVVELAGYNATPAEEMDRNAEPFRGNEFSQNRQAQKPTQPQTAPSPSKTEKPSEKQIELIYKLCEQKQKTVNMESIRTKDDASRVIKHLIGLPTIKQEGNDYGN